MQIARQLQEELPVISVLMHHKNQGKGASLRSGFVQARGQYIAIHDADMEYNPADLFRMFSYMQEHKVDVVFGTRFLRNTNARVHYFWHSLANKLFTSISNRLNGLNLMDVLCCYKMFSRHVFDGITIQENRFGVECELVAKCAKMLKNNTNINIYEMDVDYNNRSSTDGKKIGIKDAFSIFRVIIKYNLFR